MMHLVIKKKDMMHLASPLLLPMSSVPCGAPADAAAPLPRSVVMARRRPVAHLAMTHARLPGLLLSMPPRTTESLRTTAASPQLPPPPCLMVMPPRPSSSKLRRADSDSDDERRVAHKEESNEMDERQQQQQAIVCVALLHLAGDVHASHRPTDAPEPVAASV